MARSEGDDAGQMTLVEHLGELRRRIFICVIAVALGAVVMFILFPQILDILSEPYREVTKGVFRCGPDGCDLTATNPLGPFMVRLKIATYGGMALALPVIMWQIWRFIVPGLYAKERRYALPFILSAVLLFVLGVFFAWLTLDKALQFLLIGSVGGEIEPIVTADSYLTLITLMMLAFGVAFELPVLLVFLMLVGAVSSQTLRKQRRWALIGIFTFAAIITPSQDPFSLLFMAVPMYVFYEMAIVIGRVMKK